MIQFEVQLQKCILNGFICLILIALPFSVAYGQVVESSPSLHLDLDNTQRNESEIANEEDNLLPDIKPEEILSQVQMSEDAEEIVNNINNAVMELQDFYANIEIHQVKESRTDVLTGALTASVVHMAARLEIFTPSALRGQIYVVDQETMEARVYMPVTNQITIQKIEDMEEEVASTLDITDITSLFDFSEYAIEIKEVLQDEHEVVHYLLELTGYEEHVQLVRVSDTNWIPHEIIVYEDGVLMGSLLFSEVELDQEVPVEHIDTLPAGARELRM